MEDLLFKTLFTFFYMFYTYFGLRVGRAPLFRCKMVALGELLALPVAMFTATQLGIHNSENKILVRWI